MERIKARHHERPREVQRVRELLVCPKCGEPFPAGHHHVCGELRRYINSSEAARMKYGKLLDETVAKYGPGSNEPTPPPKKSELAEEMEEDLEKSRTYKTDYLE